jgi:hypothetical protein
LQIKKQTFKSITFSIFFLLGFPDESDRRMFGIHYHPSGNLLGEIIFQHQSFDSLFFSKTISILETTIQYIKVQNKTK